MWLYAVGEGLCGAKFNSKAELLKDHQDNSGHKRKYKKKDVIDRTIRKKRKTNKIAADPIVQTVAVGQCVRVWFETGDNRGYYVSGTVQKKLTLEHEFEILFHGRLASENIILDPKDCNGDEQ